jgi:hypothetical protein
LLTNQEAALSAALSAASDTKPTIPEEVKAR